jgi:hypothetical protein
MSPKVHVLNVMTLRLLIDVVSSFLGTGNSLLCIGALLLHIQTLSLESHGLLTPLGSYIDTLAQFCILPIQSPLRCQSGHSAGRSVCAFPVLS